MIETGNIFIDFLIVFIFTIILLFIALKLIDRCLDVNPEICPKLHLIIKKIFGR